MDAVMQLVEAIMASPWLYLVVLIVVAIDSVLPVLPGETVVITAGAYAVAQNDPNALWLLLFAVLGALTGDVAGHHIGRGAGPLARRIRRNKVGDKLFSWAERGLLTRGGMIIIAARFIPGGRTATTLTSGIIGYPRWRFIGWALIAATAWAMYNVGIGMLGGFAFRDQPVLGVVLGVGLALVLGIIIERLRVAREKRVGGTAAPRAIRSDLDDQGPRRGTGTGGVDVASR